jgi:malonate transporter
VTGVLTGFAIIAVVIGVGYLIGRVRLLGEHGPQVLSRLVFFVLSPALLFTVLAGADLHALFSASLLVAGGSALAAFALFALVSVLLLRQRLPEAIVGTLASGYVNANNIGIPVAVYVLGDAAYSAPVLLLQLLVFTPVALTLLDLGTSGKVSLKRVLLQPLRNPIIVASALGVLVAVTGIELPDPVFEPLRIIGAAAVPVVLIGYGMSLHGQRVLAPGSDRRAAVIASTIKLLLMPVAAWLLGSLLQLDPTALRAAVVLAALPSAQNVFNYAQRYDRGVVLARDVVFLTTIGSLPVLLIVALLLA